MIQFKKVTKKYNLYRNMSGGLKSLLFELPKHFRSFKRERYEVLREISFQVKKGETLGIIGKNGSGKSTLLALMAGVIIPDSGEIIVTGRVLPLLGLGAGFQLDLTGKENIILNGIILGLRRKEIENIYDEIVRFSELGDFIHQPIKIFSNGMFLRLAFSIAAHIKSDIVLLDEVLAVGDKNFVSKCYEKLYELKSTGVTVVIASHAMGEIIDICDRVLWLENHKIEELGDPKTVVSKYLSDSTIKL